MKKEKIQISTPQFERDWELDFNFIPSTPEEFLEVVTQAPVDILKGMGFCYWNTVNGLAAENEYKPKKNIIKIPTINIEDGSVFEMDFDIGIGDAITKQQSEDEEIYLIPGEWYNSIPEGFQITTISGRIETFQKGITDNDTRFGCLAYGIRRKL